METERTNNNKSILVILLSVILSMLCLAYAAVPLYRIFCRATGYGGTPQKMAQVHSPNKVGKQKIKVRLSADVNDIPLIFYPQQAYVITKPGVHKLVFYIAENQSNDYITGTAVYNVSPNQAGKYFNKVACFCFSEQSFAPKSKVVMPVSFFIEPEIEENPNTKDIKEITLSYTFFPSGRQDSRTEHSSKIQKRTSERAPLTIPQTNR